MSSLMSLSKILIADMNLLFLLIYLLDVCSSLASAFGMSTALAYASALALAVAYLSVSAKSSSNVFRRAGECSDCIRWSFGGTLFTWTKPDSFKFNRSRGIGWCCCK